MRPRRDPRLLRRAAALLPVAVILVSPPAGGADLPSLAAGDVTLAESDGGMTEAVFTVVLSSDSPQTVSVRYATANGTATGWVDYVPTAGVLTFAPGVRSRTVSVTVRADTTHEPAETFYLTLSAPVGATIARTRSVATIADDDGAPEVVIEDVQTPEGDAGMQLMWFPVSLTHASYQPVTVEFTTWNADAADAARMWSDYRPRAGALTFNPGVTRLHVGIWVSGDLVPELPELFAVVVTDAVNATIARAAGIGRIEDDDPAQAWELASPDARNVISVFRYTNGRLTWRLLRDAVESIAESPLGLERSDRAFTEGLQLVAARPPIAIDDVYWTPAGKRRHHAVRARERTLVFQLASGDAVEIVLRAHDDGVAFRYRFPASDDAPRTILQERTGFRIPDDSTAWMLPHGEPYTYGPAYEDLFREVPAGTSAPSPAGWSFPALFRTPAGPWLLITEAALDDAFCGSRLAADASDGLYRLRFPEPGEGGGVGDALPASTLPWPLPWRVVITGDTAARILESDLVSDLSPAASATDWGWVQPGRSAWSWWSQPASPRDPVQVKASVDLAAEMGWEYALVDANWTAMPPGGVEEVVAHARAAGVGLFFWYNSGGAHNDITEAPRDRMADRQVRRAEFAKLQAWGVRGVKVDFWHSDKQDRIRQYRELLADAADFQLLVNFHGSTLPRGWSREYPNLVTMEAVAGAEQYLFNPAYPARAAWHHTVLPFTRNVVGPMDYTPGTFSDSTYPRQTTDAHELALPILFESGVQHLADSASTYQNLPEPIRMFLRDIPAAWDATTALGGEPGRFVVVARRHGDAWYVAGINGDDVARVHRLAFGFLGPGAWAMSVVRDGGSDRGVAVESGVAAASDAVDITMRPRGGFVVRLAPAQP